MCAVGCKRVERTGRNEASTVAFRGKRGDEGGRKEGGGVPVAVREREGGGGSEGKGGHDVRREVRAAEARRPPVALPAKQHDLGLGGHARGVAARVVANVVVASGHVGLVDGQRLRHAGLRRGKAGEGGRGVARLRARPRDRRGHRARGGPGARGGFRPASGPRPRLLRRARGDSTGVRLCETATSRRVVACMSARESGFGWTADAGVSPQRYEPSGVCAEVGEGEGSGRGRQRKGTGGGRKRQTSAAARLRGKTTRRASLARCCAPERSADRCGEDPDAGGRERGTPDVEVWARRGVRTHLAASAGEANSRTAARRAKNRRADMVVGAGDGVECGEMR